MDTDQITQKAKVLVVKTSLDGHWRGVSLVARALRDNGFEVVLGGMLRPSQIAIVARDEDVELIGLNVGGRIDQKFAGSRCTVGGINAGVNIGTVFKALLLRNPDHYEPTVTQRRDRSGTLVECGGGVHRKLTTRLGTRRS